MTRIQPLILTEDQLVGASYNADKLAEKIHQVLALHDIRSQQHDVLFYRGQYQRDMRSYLEALAKECGFKLVPINNAIEEEEGDDQAAA